MLSEIKNTTYFEDFDMAFDFGLLPEGIAFNDKYVSIHLDGTAHLQNQSVPEKKSFNPVPIHIEAANDIQVMIS